MYFSVQCWLIPGPMSGTLARHCKVTVNKTSRFRDRVFDTYTTLVQSCMSYGSLIISQSTPCRLSVYAIGSILCKYYSNTIDRLNKHETLNL